MALCRYITSSFAGAPTVSGTAGELVTMLDAVLVNGFGGGTCTLSQAAGVATLTLAAHGFVDKQVVSISGATPSDYNGLKRVTYVSSSVVTFTIDSGVATPATGTITCKTASLGWTIAYTGTNKRVYQMGTGSLGFVLRVDDTGTPQNYLALVRMAESASGIDTLVDDFPTAAQINNTANYLHLHKASASNSTTRAWFVVGDERSFLIGNLQNGTNYTVCYFGELEKIDSADAFCCVISAEYGASVTSGSSKTYPQFATGQSLTSYTLSLNAPTLYFARAGNQLTKSVIGLGISPNTLQVTQPSGFTSVLKPYGTSYGLAGQTVFSDSGGMRGYMRGVYDPFQLVVDDTSYDPTLFGLPAGDNLIGRVAVATYASGTGYMLLQTVGELP